jgi:riboflavin biosynthesis pyrimidine reductase
VFDDAAPTIVLTTEHSDTHRRAVLRARDVAVRIVPPGPEGVDLEAALSLLAEMGMSSLLVEGGQRVITSLLRAGCVDRMIMSLAPILLGKGIEGVGDLGIERVADGVSLENRSVYIAGNDVLIACDVGGAGNGDASGNLKVDRSTQAPAARA